LPAQPGSGRVLQVHAAWACTTRWRRAPCSWCRLWRRYRWGSGWGCALNQALGCSTTVLGAVAL